MKKVWGFIAALLLLPTLSFCGTPQIKLEPINEVNSSDGDDADSTPTPKPSSEPEQPQEEALKCVNDGGEIVLQETSPQRDIATYKNLEECNQARLAAHGGVVCVWFTPDMEVGDGGWNETGWRPMNMKTKIGLGRKTHLSFNDCLDATKNANGGVVCTNTGVGYKAANIDTNLWCGASSYLEYCLEATAAARSLNVCSFPSDGTGAEAGWVLTKVVGECEYIGSKKSLSDCNASVPDLRFFGYE